MLFKKSESPVVAIVKSLAVPAITVIGSGVAAYFGARKGVADTVEECATAVQKVIPTFEGLLSKAEEAAEAAPAAPAESEELAKYKEAIKKLMADNAALKDAAAQPAEAPKAEAPEAPKKEKKEKKAEAPKVEEPAEKNNTGLIIAIVAVVVVVGAGLGIVLGKKKK